MSHSEGQQGQREGNTPYVNVDELSDSYEYIVIGGGSGGMASARRAASHGAKVLVIEKTSKQPKGAGLGGTCVNVGCVPKKVMFNAAAHAEMVHTAKDYGFTNMPDRLELDWMKLKTKRDALIKRLNGVYERNMDRAGIHFVLNDTAKFVPQTDEEAKKGGHVLLVDGKRIIGQNILIAVGGYPQSLVELGVPGGEHAIDSNGFFKLEKQPKKVAVLGGGYIAVELAGIFNALGSETTIYYRGAEVVKNFDSIIKENIKEEIKRAGIDLQLHVNMNSIEKLENDKLCFKWTQGSLNEIMREEFDVVVEALGRVPNTDGLGLDALGNLKTNHKGEIVVDCHQNTNVDGIYSVGDVTDKGYELTPVAIAAGRRLADRLFKKNAEARLYYSDIPTVMFSHPPIGTIGMTEEEACTLYPEDEIKVYTSEFSNLFYSMVEDAEKKPRTAMKLVCLGEEQRVIGLHIIGMGADEMLQGFAVAVKMGATKQDFDNTVAIHPTSSEELVTMAPWGMDREGLNVLPAPKPKAMPVKRKEFDA